MQETELLSAVQSTGGVDTMEHARTATEATLRTLGSRLAGGETRDLAAQLPGSLGDYLPETGEGSSFPVMEFYERVSEADGCPTERARQHARAVMAAVKASVTENEFDHLAAQLPSEYDDLLGTGPVLH